MLAWYKLNGDLLDSSGNGNHGSMNGDALTYVDGVVGKAGVFNGNKNIVLPNSSILQVKGELTISMWVKSTSVLDSTRRDVFFMGRDINSGYGTIAYGGNGFDFVIFTDTGRYNLPFTIDSILTHIVIKYDPLKGIFIYKNGILTYTKTDARGTIIYPQFYIPCLGSHGSSIYQYVGELQDFRIYDHCLSDKEIYDLSKALVLKYDFDDVEEPTVNYIPDGNFSKKIYQNPYTGGCHMGSLAIVDGDSSTPCNGNILEFTSTGNNGYMDDYMGAETKMCVAAPGDVFTVSCYFRSKNVDNIQGNIRMFPMKSDYGYITAPALGFDIGKKWTRLEFTYTMPADTIGVSVRMDNYTNGGILQMTGWQLEKKDHATPFVNGTRDQIVVRDKSDYGNDSLPLTVANTPAFVEGCKIGRQSSKNLDNTLNTHIDTGFNLYGKTAFSISAWIKQEKDNSIIIGDHFHGNWYESVRVGTGEIDINGNSGTSLRSSMSAADVFPLNQWSHFAFTYNYLTRIGSLYKDGILVKTMTILDNSIPYNSGRTLRIFRETGIEPSVSQTAFKGSLDDLRIYATALTAEDVKEIYQSRANLDDKGNLKAVILKEKNNLVAVSNEQIKTGINKDLWLYSQTNCATSLIGGAVRIYRPPNIPSGNSQWGGLIFKVPEFSLQIGKSYSLKFDYKGKTSSGISSIFAAYSPADWTVGGLPPVFATSGKDGVQSRFDTDTWRTAEMIFNITSSSLYKTATNTNGGTVVGNSYYTFRCIKIGFDYEATGDLGADVYIRNVKFYENEENLTYEKNFSIKENGDLVVENVSELGVTEGLIAYYPLNGDARDYSGNGNDGTVVGATVSAGQCQKCYSFDGSTSKIILPRTFLRLPTFTCSLWLDWKNRDSISRTLFSITETGGWRIGFSDGGSPNNLSFQIYDTSTYRWISIPNSSVPIGWNYISVSYDNIGKIAILYLNGLEVSRTTLMNGVTYGTEVNPLIGCEASVSNENDSILNGSIQDVRIYNRALTAEEVLINYDMTRPDGPKMKIGSNGTTYVRQIKEI